MKRLLCLPVLILSALSFSALAESNDNPKDNLFVNSMLVEETLSKKEAKDFKLLQRDLSTTNNSHDKNKKFIFRYVFERFDAENNQIHLADNSVWQNGWWYKNIPANWKKGDLLTISFVPIYSNNMKIVHESTQEVIWTTIKDWPSLRETIARIPNSPLDADMYAKIVLKSGWIFKAPEKRGFGSWKVSDNVFIFHNAENPDLYDLYNMTQKIWKSKCEVLSNEKQVHKGSVVIKDVANLHLNLDKRVLDQKEATKTVTSALWNYCSGLKDPVKPIGVFLFLGPSGVGKTELAKALAIEVYEGSNFLTRFDMSHFTSQYDITRLVGSSPGYVNHEEGGQLTNAIRDMPQSIVLLDEIEKAHTQIRKAFLPVFDDGYITDSKNNRFECNEIMFVLTSNMCALQIGEMIHAGYSHEQILEAIEPELMTILSPELYNRVTPVIFEPLKPETMHALVNLQLKDLVKRMKASRDSELIIDPTVNAYLEIHGYHPTLGARPLKRLIDKKVAGNLSLAIIAKGIPQGSTMVISYSEADDTWNVDWMKPSELTNADTVDTVDMVDIVDTMD